MKYTLGTFCDICKKNKSRQYTSVKTKDGKDMISIIFRESSRTSDMDVCYNCMAKILNAYKHDLSKVGVNIV